MTIQELLEKTGWKLITTELDTSTEVTGAYCGDLLSWVMGKGESGQVWITVQGHMNVIAVALLREFSAVIIADNANIPEDMIEKANEEKLILIESGLPSYETAKTLVELGV